MRRLGHDQLTVDKEELQEVQDDQQWVESVEVDIKGVTPLHVKVPAGLLQQVSVGDEPGRARRKMSLDVTGRRRAMRGNLQLTT